MDCDVQHLRQHHVCLQSKLEAFLQQRCRHSGEKCSRRSRPCASRAIVSELRWISPQYCAEQPAAPQPRCCLSVLVLICEP